MELYCTRSGCSRPQNFFADLDDSAKLKRVKQKYCTSCGMPLILLGHYLPSKLLGRGGFGAAFLARDRHTPGMRYCVVKQLKPKGDLSATQLKIAQELFEREAVVLEILGSQNEQIPDLYAFFELTVPSWQPGRQDKFFYLVQEFIDGKNLEEELQEKGNFSEVEVLELLQAMLPVLKFVHENGSIHRDIKPSNIMRHPNGKFYLLDFGAVKQATKTAGSNSTWGQTGIYSPGFAPPEQMAGSKIYPCTDLYALAVTAVVLLTGKEVTELLDAYRIKQNWQVQAQVSKPLAHVLERMLLPKAKQRFQSASEVMAALSSIKAIKSRFSTWELLTRASFSGFEVSLIAIALYSLLPTLEITLAVCTLVLVGLIFAQTKRWIENKGILLITSITLAIIFFLPVLRVGFTIQEVVILAFLGGAVAIAITALFRLIYKLLSLIFSAN